MVVTNLNRLGEALPINPPLNAGNFKCICIATHWPMLHPSLIPFFYLTDEQPWAHPVFNAMLLSKTEWHRTMVEWTWGTPSLSRAFCPPPLLLPLLPSLPFSPLPQPVPVIILHFLPRLPICGIYNHFVQAFYQVSLCARSTSNKTTKKSYSFRLSMCCTEHGRVAFQIFKSSWKSRLFVLFCSSFA